MRIITSVGAMQRLAASWLRAGTPVGFVPTMGCLHAGHMGLAAVARRSVGRRGKVVVSIYVNPTQFGPKEDFARYPRDFRTDTKQCRAAGVDVIFAPKDRDIYRGRKEEDYSTYVSEERLSRLMEGAARPGHFRGVTTIVAKLLNIVRPGMAVFGAKDYQQAAVIRRMVRDLNFPVKIVVAPTRREADGLAMSSRNRYLTGDLRRQATVLWRSICMLRERVRRSGSGVSAKALRSAVLRLVKEVPAARLDYVEFFDPESLSTVTKVTRGAHVALAVFVGKTRLIDNARV